MTASEAPPPDPAPNEAPRTRRGLRLIDLLILVFVVSVGATLSLPFLVKARQSRHRSDCSGALRQIGLAAIAYADDFRYFPHLGPIKQLDNGGNTSPRGNDVPPRVARALFWQGYLDQPALFVCAGSGDSVEWTGPAPQKTFGWKGTSESGENPILVRGRADADAAALTDLSYGYTIKGLTVNCRCDTPLFADRDVRNHDGAGWMLVQSDASVHFVPKGDDRARRLSTTGSGEGFLVIWDEANAASR